MARSLSSSIVDAANRLNKADSTKQPERRATKTQGAFESIHDDSVCFNARSILTEAPSSYSCHSADNSFTYSLYKMLGRNIGFGMHPTKCKRMTFGCFQKWRLHVGPID